MKLQKKMNFPFNIIYNININTIYYIFKYIIYSVNSNIMLNRIIGPNIKSERRPEFPTFQQQIPCFILFCNESFCNIV